VRGLTLDGTDSGIRIKSNVSRGGLVEQVTYEDVCIRDSRYPINGRRQPWHFRHLW
jgi:polygalacturonase